MTILLALPSETGVVQPFCTQSLAKFARRCQSLRSLLAKQLESKLQLQTAGMVGRHSNAGLRRCSHRLSLMHCLAAPAVPLLVNPCSKSVWFGCWLRFKTAWRLHFGSATRSALFQLTA